VDKEIIVKSPESGGMGQLLMLIYFSDVTEIKCLGMVLCKNSFTLF
jgi:hypothetical protein